MLSKKFIIIVSIIVCLVVVGISVKIIIDKTSHSTDVTASFSEEAPSSQEEISDIPSDNEDSESTESEPEKITLEVTSPKQDVTVYTDKITFKGSADPSLPLFINDKQIEVSKDGLFAEQLTLSPGSNYFTVKQGDSEYKCVVRYQKTVILEVSPTSKQTLDGGSTLSVRAKALANSKVYATFNGIKITLSERPIEHDEEYSEYFGQFEMPINYDSDKNYGKVTFSAQSSVGSGKVNGPQIVVRKTVHPQEQNYYMPTGSNYIDVGHRYIAEVVCRSAETFYPNDSIDYSRPENNYLPKGTVDYCKSTVNKIYDSGSEIELRTLRYGKQLYVKTKKIGENIKVYEGSLPDTNKVNIASFTSNGRHTVMTLDVDWKAPFNFELRQQNYKNSGKSNLDYTISSSTYSYVDIDFCYAEQLSGEINLEGNEIFSSYEIIKNDSDYTLRLHLKKTGKFYGWSAEYNSNGQLVFSFLNPIKLQADDNKYGYNLNGAVIVIDAGHGGSSPGTDGFVKSGPNEKTLNLLLAKKLEERLKSFGAKVYMTRNDDSTVQDEARMNLIRDVKPDYVISIHRNASSSPKPRGFISYHFNPYSADAAKKIFEQTDNKPLYQHSNWSGVKWHYFFLCRTTEAPSVLTENGFLSNAEEYSQTSNDAFNSDCADALVDGIFAYFKSIQ